jgi:hypothetical protein
MGVAVSCKTQWHNQLVRSPDSNSNCQGRERGGENVKDTKKQFLQSTDKKERQNRKERNKTNMNNTMKTDVLKRKDVS